MLAALIGAASWAEPALPLESESFTVDVTGNLAEIVLRQTFRNTSDEFVDATYLFPLDNDAVVDGMVLTVGDRVVRSEVFSKQEAREIWTEAAEAGMVAALTEQQRPNVFTQAVSNLPPGEPIEVELHVIQPVDRIDGEWELVLPLVVGPRFVRPGDEEGKPVLARYVLPAQARDHKADDGVRTDGTGVRATIDAVIHAGLPIRELSSPSHPITPEVTDTDASLVLDQVPLTRDVVLRWRTAGDVPQAGLLVAGHHAMLVVEAPIETTYSERVPREVIWVVDTSCSMSGAPLDRAKIAMKAALGSMDPRDSFLVLGFASEVKHLNERPMAATSVNVQQGLVFVDRLNAGGGTWMEKALHAALAIPPDPRRRRTVVFVTDGLIGHDVSLLKEIGTRSAEATFVSLGIGSAPNRFLLDEMARLGGGVSAYAPLGSDPDAEMDALVEAMDRPVLTGLQVDWGDCPAHAFAPVSMPDLRPGRPVHVLAKVEQGCQGEVVVTARSGSGTRTFRLTPEVVPRERALASTWARERVADLERQWMRGEAADVRDAVREIGLSYGIVTSETSLVAVDERVVNPDGRAVPVDQPLDLPDGLEEGAAAEVVVSARVKAVDTESSSVGMVLTKEFLQRVPAGRTYQTAVQTVPGVQQGSGGNPSLAGGATNENTYMMDGANITDPVTGTFSLNFNFDAVRELEVVDQGRLPEHPGGDAVVNVVTADGTNNLALNAGVRGLTAGPTPTGAASGSLSGPVVRDRLWFFGSADLRQAELEGVQTTTSSVFGKLTTQPTPEHRLSLTATGSPSSVEAAGAAIPYGGWLGRARWSWFLSSQSALETELHGATGRLGEVHQRAAGGSAAFSAVDVDDPLGLSHDTKLGAGGSAWQVATPDRVLDLAQVNGFAQDRWDLGRVVVAGGLRVDAIEGEVLPSPRLFAAWDWLGDQRGKLSGGVARYTDPRRYLPADLSAVSVPTTDELFVAADREIAFDLALTGSATWSRSRFGFAPAPDLVPMPDAAVPTVEREVTELELGLRKVEARRWSASASFTLVPQLDPADRALLRDPLAPYVPGFLGAYRQHGVSLAAAWDLPTDPFTLQIGGFARWASAIDPNGPWWLRDVLTLGASLAQRIDVRKGGLLLEGSVAWVENDLGSSWLPVVATFLAPGAPTVDQQPPLRIEAGLSYAF